MSKADGVPEVFGRGDLTLCLNGSDMKVYVGTTEVPVSSLSVEKTPSNGIVTVITVSRKMEGGKAEEVVRALSALPWVTVLR